MTTLLSKLVFLNLLLSLTACTTETDIDSYLTGLHEKHKLNGNVLVLKDGKRVYEKSFGYADGSKTALLDSDYRFNLGSVYKEFPGVAIVQLQQQHLLNVTDPVSKYIPELGAWAEKVTIKNLLQYSSGLPMVTWNNYFGNGLEVTDTLLFKDLQQLKALEFEPGTDYLYSNNNPILLIKIIERVSKQSFSDYINEHIFQPLQMDHTVIKNRYPYEDTSDMAIPFDSDFIVDDYSLSVNGILFSSTADDIAKWFTHLDAFKLIPQDAVEFLSEVAVQGANIQSPLGSTIWKNERLIEHTHHGSSGNYECIIRNFKEEGITIVILTNQKHGNVHEISETLYDILTTSN